jgi:hypothetical protein
MRVATRSVCIAGMTTSPDPRWMEQMARNVTLPEVGFLNGCRYLLHDRDTKFCGAFDGILEQSGFRHARVAQREPAALYPASH